VQRAPAVRAGRPTVCPHRGELPRLGPPVGPDPGKGCGRGPGSIYITE
jgi:hypothetical protein